MSPQLSPGCVPITPPGSLSPPHVGGMGAKRCRAVTTSHGQSTARHHTPHPTPPTGGPVPTPPFTLARGRTMKAPPPPDSTMMARNLGLTAQNELSHVTLETRMSSYIWSAFTGCPKTCRNLLWRTTRRLMAGGGTGQDVAPPSRAQGPQHPQISCCEGPPSGFGRERGDVGMAWDGGTGWNPVWSSPHGGTWGSCGCWGGCWAPACHGTVLSVCSAAGMWLCCAPGLCHAHGRAVPYGCALPHGRAIPRGCPMLYAPATPMVMPRPMAVLCSTPIPPPWLRHILCPCHPHGCAMPFGHHQS